MIVKGKTSFWTFILKFLPNYVNPVSKLHFNIFCFWRVYTVETQLYIYKLNIDQNLTTLNKRVPGQC